LRKNACIGLGSNLGDSLRIVHRAWQVIGRQPGIEAVALSSPYRSEPVGMASPNWFINGVGLLRTTLSPDELLARLLALEKEFGRQRDRSASGYQDRILDLDLLLYDDLVYAGERLVLPHPELHRRLFVLLPLAEIAPTLRHPVLARTVQELLLDRLRESDRPLCLKAAWPETEAAGS
jgi:2-amino-4-hydroxy-6-hydroxymethyldihydropteridine diphosphokinase